MAKTAQLILQTGWVHNKDLALKDAPNFGVTLEIAKKPDPTGKYDNCGGTYTITGPTKKSVREFALKWMDFEEIHILVKNITLT